MDKYFIIAQILGFAGPIFFMTAYLFKSRKGILLFQILGQTAMCIHFFLLGGITGAVTDIIGISRNIIYYNSAKKWASSKLWIYLFSVLFTVAMITTWNGWQSLLPYLSMISATIGFHSVKEKVVRISSAISSPCWLVYDILNNSYTGTVMEAVTFTSIIISIVRFDILKKTVNISEVKKSDESA